MKYAKNNWGGRLLVKDWPKHSRDVDPFEEEFRVGSCMLVGIEFVNMG